MNQLDLDYQNLLKDILENGVEKETRNGKTLSVFGRQIKYNFKDGKFPLLTTKKMAWKVMVTELLWFLRGDTNIKFLVDNDCNIWNGDAYKNYLKGGDIKWLKQTEVNTPVGKMNIPIPYSQEEFINKIKTDDEFANKWGELGPVYGKQWRSWHWRSEPVLPGEKDMIYTTEGKLVTWSEEKYIDQIANLINELKTNPDSRRLMVNSWNVGELGAMVLPPCHYGFQMYTRELNHDERFRLYVKRDNPLYPLNVEDVDKHLTLIGIPTRAISLMWNQRSVDTFLGLPFNIASYGLLLMMIADEVNMVPDQLIGNLGDVHLYNNHIEQAKEQISRTPYELPTVHVRDGIESSMPGDIILENYQSHPSIKAPLSN
jgi:thymidylate synthase